MQLHNYQKKIVDFICMHDRCILSVDMGLGKTISVLTFLEYYRPASVLVVAPKRVAENNWKQEAEKWGLQCAEKFEVIKGTKAKRLAAISNETKPYKVISRDNLNDVAGNAFEVLVIDELTSFKTFDSSRSKAVQSIEAERKIGLTGTFLANGAIDIYGQAAACGISCGKESFYSWRASYFRDCLKGSGLAFQKWVLSQPLTKVLEPIQRDVFTLTADDWLEIPEKSITTHRVDVGQEIRQAIGDLDAFLCADLDGETVTFNEGQKFAKLQTLCNGFVYLDDGGAVRGAESKKLAEVADFVEECHDAGEPVLLFYAFREEYNWLREMLEARKIKCETPDGKNFVERWNGGEIDCLLCHPASAGHGLNLQHGGRVVVWSTLTYNYEYYAQANARLARQGQKRNVQIHIFLADGTVEERVAKALEIKDNTQKEFLNITK